MFDPVWTGTLFAVWPKPLDAVAPDAPVAPFAAFEPEAALELFSPVAPDAPVVPVEPLLPVELLLAHFTQKTFCLSSPDVAGEVCFAKTLSWLSGSVMSTD